MPASFGVWDPWCTRRGGVQLEKTAFGRNVRVPGSRAGFCSCREGVIGGGGRVDSPVDTEGLSISAAWHRPVSLTAARILVAESARPKAVS